MNDHRSDREIIADEAARRLLERAAELDVSGLELAHLRGAAVEAGISEPAFDAAVSEWRRSDLAVTDREATEWPSRNFLRNAAGIAAGWAAVTAFALIDRATGMPWLMHKLTDPLGLALGALIAFRLKARAATILLCGLALAQSTEFLMDLATGAPALQGFGPHVGLMIAGVAAAALGSYVLPDFAESGD